MKAVLLAAGVGRRLKPLTDELPKCLLEAGGRSLIQRELASLAGLGVKEAVIVVGHLADKIKEKVGSHFNKLDTRYIYNERYREGSIVSLWAARGEFDDDLLIMDADVFFPDEFLSRLIYSRNKNCFLLDEKDDMTDEEMKLGADKEGRVREIARRLSSGYPIAGEGVGFLKISKEAAEILKDKLDEFIKEGRFDAEYEEAINATLNSAKFGFEKVTGSPWTEIDFKEDIERAGELAEAQDRKGHISINRRLSAQLTKILAKTPLTPNQITFLSLIAGLVSAYLFSRGGYPASVFGALFFQASYTLDNCDGEIARLKGLQSSFGRIFDPVCDVVIYIALFWGITVGIYRALPENYIIAQGAAALIGTLSSFFAVGALEKRGKGPTMYDSGKYGIAKKRETGALKTLLNKLGGGDFSLILLGFALLGAMRFFLVSAAIGANIYWLSLIRSYEKD